MSNYTQQCQRPGCNATFDGTVKSAYCSDKCEMAAEWIAGPPKCPTCGLVMCQQFDEDSTGQYASLMVPNGKYKCYHCNTAAAGKQ